MTETVTSWAEAIGLLAIALGLAWFVREEYGTGWALLALGTVILCMSAGLAALGRRKGGTP